MYICMCLANSLISCVQVWQLFCMNAGWAAWKTTSHSRLLNILRLWSWCLVCLRPLCMQVLFPNGFVHLFQNPGESSADPGMDSSNLVRFSSRKVQLYFCRFCVCLNRTCCISLLKIWQHIVAEVSFILNANWPRELF